MGGDDREVLAATMDLKAETGTATGVGHTGQADEIHGLFIWLQNNRFALAAEANFVALLRHKLGPIGRAFFENG